MTGGEPISFGQSPPQGYSSSVQSCMSLLLGTCKKICISLNIPPVGQSGEMQMQKDKRNKQTNRAKEQGSKVCIKQKNKARGCYR